MGETGGALFVGGAGLLGSGYGVYDGAGALGEWIGSENLSIVEKLELSLRIGNAALGTVTGPFAGVGLLRSGTASIIRYPMKSGDSMGIGYRVIESQYAKKTIESGVFYHSGLPGRIGNDGLYINNTVEGAIREFQYHKNTPFTVFEVEYPTGPSLEIIRSQNSYVNQALPFTGDVNILTSPSLRAPGTTNLLIRKGAAPVKIITSSTTTK